MYLQFSCLIDLSILGAMKYLMQPYVNDAVRGQAAQITPDGCKMRFQ